MGPISTHVSSNLNFVSVPAIRLTCGSAKLPSGVYNVAGGFCISIPESQSSRLAKNLAADKRRTETLQALAPAQTRICWWTRTPFLDDFRGADHPLSEHEASDFAAAAPMFSQASDYRGVGSGNHKNSGVPCQ